MSIHAEMLTLQVEFRDEDFDAMFREDADNQLWDDAEYDAWLDDFLNDAYEAWLDDWNADVAVAVAKVADPAYVPFQQTERYCQLQDEIGYLESTAPYLF